MSGFVLVGSGYTPRKVIMAPGAVVRAEFMSVGTGTSGTTDVPLGDALTFDLTPRYQENMVPGSVNFTLAGKRYFDRAGQLYTDLDPATGAASVAGSINYTTGEVNVGTWTAGGSPSVTMNSLLTASGDNLASYLVFRIPVSPVRPGSLQLLATKQAGGQINVTAGTDGTISGSGVRGTVDYETGVVSAQFGQLVTAADHVNEPWYDERNVEGSMIWEPAFVFADTMRYNAVSFTYLPLDADILGLDPVRLPQDGRVAIYRVGGFVVIGHAKSVSTTVSNGQTVSAGRTRLSRVRVTNANGVAINTGYTVDLEAGTITFTDITGYVQPVTIEDRVEDMLVVRDVQISGELAFTRAITHDYPVGSYVSSALVMGNLFARVSTVFDQATWDGTSWLDTVDGAPATGTYNTTLSPIEVTNAGASNERFALRFTSSTSFQVIGEHVGVVDVGSINADCAPINPATGEPYFTIRALGWGGGWATGNIVRINTVGALAGIWLARTVQPGPESGIDYKFSLLTRGDVDRP